MQYKGFTLVELLSTIAIVAMLTAVGIPSFHALLGKNPVESQANIILETIENARRIAIYNNDTVTVCKSNDQFNCTDGDWAEGWIVFTDNNANQVVDANEKIVSYFDQFPQGLSVLTSEHIENSISFLPTGELSDLGGEITICGSKQDTNIQKIHLSAVGNTRIERNAASCS